MAELMITRCSTSIVLKRVKSKPVHQHDMFSYLTEVLSEVMLLFLCGPPLRRDSVLGCLSGRVGAALGTSACLCRQQGFGWGSASAERGPGGGSVHCLSLCLWYHPGSWSAGPAPWAYSCPPPCADLGWKPVMSKEAAFNIQRCHNVFILIMDQIDLTGLFIKMAFLEIFSKFKLYNLKYENTT